MTFALKGAGGTASSVTANQTSLALTTATTAGAAGDLAVLLVAVDNFQTTDGDEVAISSITWTGGTWTKAIAFCNGQTAAQAGVTCEMWYCNETAAVATGSTITINFTNATARDASAAVLTYFTKTANSIAVLDGTATLANDAAVPGSLNVTTAAAARLRIRATASETNVSSNWTKTTAFTAATGFAFTASGGATANVGIRGEYVVSSATSVASLPTFANSVDQASVYAVFKESYSLVAETGTTYALTIANSVSNEIRGVAAQGAYALTGRAATLSRTTVSGSATLVAVSGSYALTGRVADLIRSGASLIAVRGSYALTIANSVSNETRAVAAFGSYALTGRVATLTKSGGAVVMPAVTGNYAVSGPTAMFAGSMAGVRGNYALTGRAALFDLKRTAAFGSYGLTGRAALFDLRRTAAQGAYALTGRAALFDLRRSAVGGNYGLTGQAATLSRTTARTLVCASGSYALGGQAALFGVTMPAITGS
jgi:hypothetical protein